MESTITNQPLYPVQLLFLFLLLAIPAFSGQLNGEPVDSIGILSPQSGIRVSAQSWKRFATAYLSGDTPILL